MSNRGNPDSNDSKPPGTAQQRAMEQAAQRSARAAQGCMIAAMLVPFIAYRGFHVPWPTALVLHLGFVLLALRHTWTWWTCRHAQTGSPLPGDRVHATQESRPMIRAQGSYPSRTVRVIPSPSDDPETWLAVTQGMVQQELLGTFDDRPVYRWIRLDDHWFHYESIDRLDAPINDRDHHLVLGGVRYLQLPDDHPGPEVFHTGPASLPTQDPTEPRAGSSANLNA